MESYYSNTYCDLAATASLGESEGLSRCRDTDRVQHTEYAIPGSRSRRAGLYNVFDIILWEKELTQAPLHRQAWVLQERLLARRVLHFGERQLMWEWHEHAAADIYSSGIKEVSPLVQRAHFKDLDYYPPWNRAELKTDDLRTVTLRIWERIVNQYSQCLLTYPSDRVKALDGIARRFERMLDDECVFGMWKSDMARQFLWRVEGGGLYPPSNLLYTEQRWYAVPSWSWLAADCAIDTGKPSEIRQMQSQDILLEMVMPPANLRGDAHRTLILRCCPLAVTAILGHHGLWRVKEARADKDIRGHTRKVRRVLSSFIRVARGRPMQSDRQLMLSQGICIDRYISEVNEVGDSIPLTCVPVRPYGEEDGSADVTEYLECLLLSLVVGQNDTFQRVGIRTIDGHENINHFLDSGWDGPTRTNRRTHLVRCRSTFCK